MSKRNLRRISQGLFLLFFLFLVIQTESKRNDPLGYPVKLFLDFDPLISITPLLTSHASKIPAAFFLSIITILLTMILGRVFCGWMCPLGTLNNIVGSLRKRHSQKIPYQWHKAKYYLLLFLIASSIFTLQLVGIVDPLSLLIRSFSLSVYPLLNYGIRGMFDAIYQTDIPIIVNVSEYLYNVSKKTFLSFQQPYYLQGIFVGFLFFFVLGLNLLEKRFWCKYLCPLGALLGLLSRYAFLKRDISEGCTSCGTCDTVCQGGALPHTKEDWRKTECLACFNCDDICPANGVSFGFGRKKVPSMDLGRRNVVLSLFSGALTVPFLRANPLSKSGYSYPKLLRPPGSLEEKEFLKRCVKCGEG